MAKPDAVWNAKGVPFAPLAPRLRNPFKSLRIAIARGLSRLLKLLALRPAGCRAVEAMRNAPVLGSLIQALLAFYRPFPNLEAGEAYIRHYIAEGHDHPHQYYAHLGFAEITRESDYAVLYHLAPIAAHLRTVFDLGGSIGNVFYAYDRRLHFSPDLRWTIKELPVKKQQLLDFARSRGETRIGFTEEFSEASGVDLFIVTGALPFFEDKLSTMLGRLAVLPSIVVVDRTPFSKQGDFVTAQDAGLWAHAFKLHDLGAFLLGMSDLGYVLIDRWPVHERKFLVPLYPELNDHYWGFLFKLKGSDVLRPSPDDRKNRVSETAAQRRIDHLTATNKLIRQTAHGSKALDSLAQPGTIFRSPAPAEPSARDRPILVPTQLCQSIIAGDNRGRIARVSSASRAKFSLGDLLIASTTSRTK